MLPGAVRAQLRGVEGGVDRVGGVAVAAGEAGFEVGVGGGPGRDLAADRRALAEPQAALPDVADAGAVGTVAAPAVRAVRDAAARDLGVPARLARLGGLRVGTGGLVREPLAACPTRVRLVDGVAGQRRAEAARSVRAPGVGLAAEGGTAPGERRDEAHVGVGGREDKGEDEGAHHGGEAWGWFFF